MIKVLIIDDDELDGRQVERLLKRCSEDRYETRQVSNYSDGLQSIIEQHFDAYLIDHHLGAETGLDLIKAARKAGNEQALILLTGQVDEKIERIAKQHGASDFLDKNLLQAYMLDRSIRMAIERHAFEHNKMHNDRLITIGTLSASIAHQFNNINAMVIGNLEMILRKHELPSDAKERLNNILESMDRASSISSTLLSFTRSGADRNMDSLQQVAEDVSLLLNSDKRLSSITLDLEKNLHQTHMNRNLIGQVVMNLAINARHATVSEEVPSIIIRTGESGDEVFLSVSDNGCGIDPEYLDQIFNPFYTTKPSYTSADNEITGTGLGLSLSHNIISNHGGRITVDSIEGRGSTFVIWLPKSKSQESVQASSMFLAITDLDTKLNCLVIDDEDVICDILQTTIIEEGHSCQSFTEAEDSYQLIQQTPFDLITLDLQMPKTSGLEVLEKIRQSEANKDTAVVIISGWVNEQDRHTAEGLSAIDIIKKPFSLEKIEKLLKKIQVRKRS